MMARFSKQAHLLPPPCRPPPPTPAKTPPPPPRSGVLLVEGIPLGPNEALLTSTVVAGARQYTFTLVPAIGGGKPIVINSKSSFSNAQGLAAGTKYSVTLVARDAKGNRLESPLKLSFTTPSPGCVNDLARWLRAPHRGLTFYTQCRTCNNHTCC